MQNAKPLAGTEYEYRDTIDGNAPALPPVPDDSPTPCPRQRLTLATLCLAVLIAQIDTAVVNLAVEPIRAYFQAGITAMQWVVDSYNLVYALLLLSGGLLADMFGRKRIFQAGVALFAGASLLCGVAQSVGVLILGRMLAGVGAALLTPASLAILRIAWPNPARRGKALGIWAACNGLAFAVAPTLGGVMIVWFGWRSIFLLAIPVCLLALTLAMLSISESSSPDRRHVDLAAQAMGALALGGLALAVIEADRQPVIALAALMTALAGLVAFLRIEARKGASAMVPLAMFKAPALRGAIIATAGMTLGMYGVLFLQPLVWQRLGILTTVQAGLALMPMALVFLFTSPFTGRLSSIMGERALACGGVMIIGAGLLLIGLGAWRPTIACTEAGLILTGLGMGLATGPLMGLAVGAVSPARSGTASALINTARIVGATVGVAALGTLFSSAADPVTGLSRAMVCGGVFQIACAAIAWRTIGKSPPRE